MSQLRARLRISILYNDDIAHLPLAAPGLVSHAAVVQMARSIARALTTVGHTVTLHGVDVHRVLAVIDRLAADPPDLVFNLCESLGGQARLESAVPTLLDLIGVPYTGSGPEVLALALRKDRTQALLGAHGLPIPQATRLDRPPGDDLPIVFPVIVKPACEDASIGIDAASVVYDRRTLAAAVSRVLDELAQPALVERYIDGREIYASLLGNNTPRVLPLHEIDFSQLPHELPRIVCYRAKWDPSSREYAGTLSVRCTLDQATHAHIEHLARSAFTLLELRDYARIDFRLTTAGDPYIIDVNPNCDLSEDAGFSRAACYAGLDYASLIERVAWSAYERARHGPDPAHTQFVTRSPNPAAGDDLSSALEGS